MNKIIFKILTLIILVSLVLPAYPRDFNATEKIRLLPAAGTDVEISVEKLVIGGTTATEQLDVAGNITTRAQGELKLQDTAGGEFVSLRSASAVTSYTLTMPNAQGASNQILKNDGAGAFSWVSFLEFTAINDNRLMRSDLPGGDIQESGITVDDSDQITNVARLNIETQGELRLEDTAGGEFVGLRLTSVATTYVLTFPNDQGAANQALSNDGTGVLSWVDFLSFTPANDNRIIRSDLAGNIQESGISINDTDQVTGATQYNILAQGDLRLEDTAGGQFVALQASGTISASYTLTLPIDDGTANQFLQTDGLGVLVWAATSPTFTVTDVTTTNYAVLSTDNTLSIDSSSNTVTLDLPTAASSDGKIYWFFVDDDTNIITIDPNGAETILIGDQTVTTFKLLEDGDKVQIQSNGVSWLLLNRYMGWRVDANISGANVDLAATDQTTYIGIENGSLTLTNNTNLSNVAIACSGTEEASIGDTTCTADESIGITFDDWVGRIRACVSYSHITAGVSAGGFVFAAFQAVETPNNAQTISTEGGERIFSFGPTDEDGGASLKICGIFSVNGKTTLRLFYEQDINTTVNSNFIAGDASATIGQRDIHWSVIPIY